MLWNKSLNTIQEVDPCHLAYQKCAESVQGVVFDLHASFALVWSLANSVPLPQLPKYEPNAYFVDYQYYCLDRSRSETAPSMQRRCIVCKELDCWSTNHSTEVRLDAILGNKVFCQFMATLKIEDSNEGEKQLVNALDDMTAYIFDVSLSWERKRTNKLSCILHRSTRRGMFDVCFSSKVSSCFSLRIWKGAKTFPQRFSRHHDRYRSCTMQ